MRTNRSLLSFHSRVSAGKSWTKHTSVVCFFSLQVYTAVRPSVCLSLNVCRRVSVCLPQSRSVLCAVCLVCGQAHSHLAGWEFSPLAWLRDRFNCGGAFTKQSKAGAQELAGETKKLFFSLYAAFTDTLHTKHPPPPACLEHRAKQTTVKNKQVF